MGGPGSLQEAHHALRSEMEELQEEIRRGDGITGSIAGWLGVGASRTPSPQP